MDAKTKSAIANINILSTQEKAELILQYERFFLERGPVNPRFKELLEILREGYGHKEFNDEVINELTDHLQKLGAVNHED